MGVCSSASHGMRQEASTVLQEAKRILCCMFLLRPPRAADFCLVALTVLSLALPGALVAQSVIEVLPQQCVWRAGNDPAWAAPNLDEAGWGPYAEWKLQPGQTHIWVRCHPDLSSLAATAHPAIQVTLFGAYRLYLNGTEIGGAGNMRSGDFSVNAIRAYPVAATVLSSDPLTLALSMTHRTLSSNSSPTLGFFAPRLELRAGDVAMLDALRARTVLAQSFRYTKSAIGDGIIAVIAVMLLGLFYYDRSRRDLLLLSIACLSAATLRVNEFCVASLLDYSFALCLTLVLVGNVCLTFTQVPFFYALARRRLPLFYRIVLVIAALPYLPTVADILLGSHQPGWLGTLNTLYGRPCALIVHMTLAIAPFVVFWPYKGISGRMRPLAALCMLWGLADLIWFAVEASANPLIGIRSLFAQWGPTLIALRSFTVTGVLAALLALLFREQRQATQERAMLAGDMQAARAVQEVIIPDAIPSVPGFRIESVYKPAGEVGGDFFQILPTAAQGVLIVIGDVSGKGMPAALTVSLLVGTVRTLVHYTQSPGEMLAAMNQRMLGRQQGGFTTCLVVRIDSDGTLTAANAGHIAPYVNGKELPLENGLPLGLDAQATYPESQLQFPSSGQLTLLTDGVAEARNANGDLFGFDRTAAISTQSAEEIAHAAQTFGQEDDITVLTVTRQTLDLEQPAGAGTLAAKLA